MAPRRWTTPAHLLKKLKPWDIVQIKREFISHFVLFVCKENDGRDGWCVHVQPQDPVSKSMSTQDVLGWKETIRYSEITEGAEFVCKSWQNGDMDWYRGILPASVFNLTALRPRSPEEVEKMASEGIEDARAPVRYNAAYMNCEHYCVHWKFKSVLGTSRQSIAVRAGACVAFCGVMLAGLYAGIWYLITGSFEIGWNIPVAMGLVMVLCCVTEGLDTLEEMADN